MNTTVDKLNGLKNTKQAIKQAIINKGVAVDEAATFASYANKIGEIVTGGPETPQAPKITCYDTWMCPYSVFSTYTDWLPYQFKSIDWTNFNKLQRTSLSSLFDSWPLSTIDIKNLKTDSATSLSDMFNSCSNLTTLDVKHFNTENVTWMGRMFNSCSKLTELDVSNFKTSKVSDMQSMFKSCSGLKSLNFSNWDTTELSLMVYMFDGCKLLTDVVWGNNWGPNPDLSEISFKPEYDFYAIPPFTKETILDLINKLAIRTNTPTLSLPAVMYDKLTSDEIKIAQDKGWTVTRV